MPLLRIVANALLVAGHEPMILFGFPIPTQPFPAGANCEAVPPDGKLMRRDGCCLSRGSRAGAQKAEGRNGGFHVAVVLASLALTPAGARADTGGCYRATGHVEPLARVTVANRLTGVIADVLFEGGETVVEGTVLAKMDDAAERIAVDAARSVVDEAQVQLKMATGTAGRAATLCDRGTTSAVSARAAESARAIAAANLARAESGLARAELDLAWTEIKAPISGRIGLPLVAPGSFVEAEAGTRIAEIVTVDPVRVAYQVPYETRLASLAASGTTDARAMFAGLTLRFILPGGTIYPEVGRPQFENATIDPASDTVTSWGVVDNPDGVLIPGLTVTVVSQVGPQSADESSAELTIPACLAAAGNGQ